MLVDTIYGKRDSGSFAISLSTKRLIAPDITGATLIYPNKYMAPSGFSLGAGNWLKNWLLRVLSCLLFQEIEESEKGT